MNMRPEISPERLSELIGAIYDCVITPEKWRATIDAIRLEFDFKGGGFYLCAFPSGSTDSNIPLASKQRQSIG
jgi:hypothetical protein